MHALLTSRCLCSALMIPANADGSPTGYYPDLSCDRMGSPRRSPAECSSRGHSLRSVR
ncbi:hypothetical protein C8T65DRAFT_657216 [Cerioporus squamosus]|nr:hypothetical protein C8T65DRAFT_657216 [Cerioporus squamosus]